MPRNGVVFPQPQGEVSFPRQDFFVNLQSFGAVSHGCAAHRSQSEAKMLSSFRQQCVLSQNLAKQQQEPGGGSTLPCPLLPLSRRNHNPADTPSPVCKQPVPQTTAPCPKLNPAFSHSFQKTEALLELLGQRSFPAPILAAICPDQGIFFMAEECVAQHICSPVVVCPSSS